MEAMYMATSTSQLNFKLQNSPLHITTSTDSTSKEQSDPKMKMEKLPTQISG